MTQDEWNEWLLDEKTQEFFSTLKHRREQLKEEWAQSAYTASDSGAGLQANALALGHAQELLDIIEVDYEHYCEWAGI